MADETVLDYLGHPCEIAKAQDLFQEPLNAARTLDSQPLGRDIGRLLNEVNDRDLKLGAAIELAITLAALFDGPNDEGFRALLAMTHSYRLDSSNMVWALSGKVLAALERGKLVEVSHV